MKKVRLEDGTEVEPILLTADEVAEVMRLSRATVHRMLAKGELPVVKLTERRWRVPYGALQGWVSDRTEGVA
jgi:excisionase family DNA binding protein